MVKPSPKSFEANAPKRSQVTKKDGETIPYKGDELLACEAEELKMVEIEENMRV